MMYLIVHGARRLEPQTGVRYRETCLSKTNPFGEGALSTATELLTRSTTSKSDEPSVATGGCRVFNAGVDARYLRCGRLHGQRQNLLVEMPYEIWSSHVRGDYVGQITRSINTSRRRGRVDRFTHCNRDAHGDDMPGAEMYSAWFIWSSHGLDHAPRKSEFSTDTPLMRDVFVIASGVPTSARSPSPDSGRCLRGGVVAVKARPGPTA
jgi:hypothetical protein